MRGAATRVAETLHTLLAEQAWPTDYRRLVEGAVLSAGRAPPQCGGIARWPALVLACADTCGVISEAAVQVAVAAALLMAALDVFDDVEDGELPDDTDPAIAANVGTGLLLLFQRVCATPCLRALPAPGAQTLLEAALRACGGQHRDLSCRATDAGMSPEEAVAITAAKSAGLVAALCRVGALAGGAQGLLLARYAAFGHHLGMATQLANDLSVVQGLPAITADLIHQRPTLPLVYAQQQAGDAPLGAGTLLPADALQATWVVLHAHRLRALRVLGTIERVHPTRALLEPFLP